MINKDYVIKNTNKGVKYKGVKYVSLILFLISFFNNCEKKDIIENSQEKEIAVLNFEVLCKSENSNRYLPDTGTDVYVFYDVSLTEVTLYTFVEGKLVRGYGTDIIYPDIIDQVENNGRYTIIPPATLSKIPIFFASNHYNKIGLKSTFSDDLLNFHQFEQNIRIVFNN